MNKLMGFYELKASGLPTVEWKQFSKDSVLDSDLLWTVRTAIKSGNDTDLPRIVGATSEDAYNKGMEILNKLGSDAMVIYYPYFIAEKSGTLYIDSEKTVIEAVDKDLWNFVTNNNKDVTIVIDNNGNVSYNGNEKFLEQNDIDKLFNYGRKVRGLFRNFINEGKAVLLEWSFAYDCNKSNEKSGSRYLVFYEIRSI